MSIRKVFAAAALVLFADAAIGSEPTHAPLVIEQIKVYDGDTIYGRLPSLPWPLTKVGIRLVGIDTPEKGWRAKCELEAQRAVAAMEFIERTLGDQHEIQVFDFDWDKYGGRILGRIFVEGRSLADLLIENGHAVPYSGTGPKQDWCQS